MHRLRYAVVTGARIADAVRYGYRMNLPVRTVAGASAVLTLRPFQIITLRLRRRHPVARSRVPSTAISSA
ncbi:hypothetical protein [Krasilnikovia cinnamomea]|uniref:hypothetical protein n=1 Tax=Krasilnikovia cinnamomea TaxID=349313 RepID=UPI001A913BA2|nr:hypothetical protein [Krasilnikovia cinnamomea]